MALMQRSDQERIGQFGTFGRNILLRKGRLGTVVNGRDQFIREAVLQQGISLLRSPNFSIAIHPT